MINPGIAVCAASAYILPAHTVLTALNMISLEILCTDSRPVQADAWPSNNAGVAERRMGVTGKCALIVSALMS